ncbi:MAG: hypothetical protein H0V92_13090 [Pseudonocardiales bacterium]|nr:hypothetical protein [Pseudonocardiales bacterium]
MYRSVRTLLMVCATVIALVIGVDLARTGSPERWPVPRMPPAAPGLARRR